MLGIRTNIPFLIRLLDHAAFRRGEVHTRFHRRASRGPGRMLQTRRWRRLAAAGLAAERTTPGERSRPVAHDRRTRGRGSAGGAADMAERTLRLRHGSRDYTVTIVRTTARLRVDGVDVAASGRRRRHCSGRRLRGDRPGSQRPAIRAGSSSTAASTSSRCRQGRGRTSTGAAITDRSRRRCRRRSGASTSPSAIASKAATR